MKPLNGWKFDEMEGKSQSTEKRISYPYKYDYIINNASFQDI